MPWEPRGNGKLYYYRAASHATGGVREYVGFGPVAEMCASLDLIERAEKLAVQQQESEFRQRWKGAEKIHKAAHLQLERIIFSTLTAQGYHRPKREAWRKVRRRKTEKKTMGATKTCDDTQQEHDVSATVDLLGSAESAWLDLISGGDMALRESLREALTSSQQRLAEEGDTELMQLLVRRVALCELQAAHADATYAKCQDVSLRQASFLIERQRAAQNRLLQAIRTLSQVRRLAKLKNIRAERQK